MKCSIIAKTALVLKEKWLDTPPEEGTGVLKHIEVAILRLCFTEMLHFVCKVK
jgi:hypothetical protein